MDLCCFSYWLVVFGKKRIMCWKVWMVACGNIFCRFVFDSSICGYIVQCFLL